MRPKLARPAALVGLMALAALGPGCSRPAASTGPLRIAAAADLAFAFGEIGREFEHKTGTRPTFSFGSTGLLARQIAEGGPFDVFAAANVSFVSDAVKAGACDGTTEALYARGRIVAWTSSSPGSAAPPGALGDLADSRFHKIAIANPAHAPYGRAAKQALENAGLWQAVSSRLVLGENVQQTLKYAQTGNAEVAIVALSLAIATPGGAALPIDEALHEPIDQSMVVCRHGANAELGRSFVDFVNSQEGRVVMRRFGFLRPGETMARKD